MLPTDDPWWGGSEGAGWLRNVFLPFYDALPPEAQTDYWTRWNAPPAWVTLFLHLDPDKLVFIDETWASPAWHAVMDVADVASACAPASPSNIGRPRSSSPACAAPAWSRPGFEQAFSKLKAHLRKGAERTIHGLWNAIGRILDLYSPKECANYCAACGYDAD